MLLRTRTTLLLVMLLLVVAGRATAQQQRPDLPRAELSGKIVAVTARFVEIEAETIRVTVPRDSEQVAPDAQPGTYVVALGRNAKVRTVGSADASFLARGQYVRLATTLDTERGRFEAPVEQVTVFVPEGNFEPAIEVAPDKFSFVKEVKPERIKRVDIAGRVQGVRGNQLTVIAKQPVTVQLTKDAKVSFTVPNFSLVQKDDTVTVRGQFYGPGKVIGNDVTVTLKNPVGVKPERPKKTAEKGDDKKPDGKKPPGGDVPD